MTEAGRRASRLSLRHWDVLLSILMTSMHENGSCSKELSTDIVDEQHKYIHSRLHKLGQGLRTFGLTDSLPEALINK